MFKNQFKLNKKAQIEDWADFMFAIIIMGLILFMVFGITHCQETEAANKINSESEKITGNFILNQVIQNPVKLDNWDMTLADLIDYSYINDDYSQLRQELKTILDPIYPLPGLTNWRSWRIEIYLMPENKQIFGKDGPHCINQGGLSLILLSEINLPSQIQGKYFKIKLYSNLGPYCAVI